MLIPGVLTEAQKKAVVQKWDPWLKDVKNKEHKASMAVILENQRRYNKSLVLKEAASGTTTTDAGVFQKVILPVVRRVYPRLIAPELVGMQPMTGPHGVAVFLRYYYDAAGTQILEPQGNQDGRRVRFSEYEGTQYLKAVSGTGITIATISGTTQTTTIDFSGLSVLPGSASYVSWLGSAQLQFNVTVTDGTTPVTDTIIAVNTAASDATAPTWSYSSLAGNFTISTVAATAPTATNEITVVSAPTDFTKTNLKWQFQAFTNTGGSTTLNNVTIPGGAAAAAATLTDTVYINDSGCPLILAKGIENQAPASLRVKFETHPIVAEDYKLNAAWSIEANQDVSNLYGEGLEELLANLLTSELLNEIDYLVIKDLLNISAYTLTWNKFPGVQSGLSVTTSGTTAMPAFRGSTRDHWETLAFAMNDMANSIQTRILRGPANFAVCSPDVSTIVESYPEFSSNTTNAMDTEVGTKAVGALSSRFKIYKDPRLPKGTMLMGYKGADAQNTGYVFAPYIPATLGPVVWNPTTYEQSRLVLSRFGKTTLLDGQFYYGKIKVTESNLASSDWTSV